MPSFVWKPYRPYLAPAVVSLWNRALGHDFPLTRRVFLQCTETAPSYDPNDSTIIMQRGRAVAYVLTKRFREDDPLRESVGKLGWIDALVVDPAHQRQGLGRDLLAWAVYRLRSEGAEQILLGGGIDHLLPGVPAGASRALGFFSRAGFEVFSTVHDLRGSLRGFVPPPSAAAAVAAAGSQVTPCTPADVPALLAFLRAEFPGRWRYDTERYLSRGGAPEDIIILRRGGDVVGFAHICHSSSAVLTPNVYWHKLLGRRFGGLGPIGVAAAVRGQGLGLALLQLSLQHLADLGATDGCIDWTTSLDFYARVGFLPWKSYTRMQL